MSGLNGHQNVHDSYIQGRQDSSPTFFCSCDDSRVRTSIMIPRPALVPNPFRTGIDRPTPERTGIPASRELLRCICRAGGLDSGLWTSLYEYRLGSTHRASSDVRRSTCT